MAGSLLAAWARRLNAPYPAFLALAGAALALVPSAPTLSLEITVDIQDLSGNYFVTEGSNTPLIGVPATILSPPAARF